MDEWEARIAWTTIKRARRKLWIEERKSHPLGILAECPGAGVTGVMIDTTRLNGILGVLA